MLKQDAERHFEQARKEARREQLAASLSGRDYSLIPFEAIRAELRDLDPRCEGLQYVPLDKIVGSVGRYADFTRHFLPLNDSVRSRWVQLELLLSERDWPPIALYRIGDVYFVIDGNHRVAVAHQLQRDEIPAHVWALAEDVPLDREETLDEMLIRLGEAHFLDKTGLADSYPDHDVTLTTAGRYRELLAQIHELQQTLALIDGEEMTFQEAALAWYEMIYLPAELIVKESNLLDHFPQRTVADLLVWLSRNREALHTQYGDFEHLSELLEQVADDTPIRTVERVARQVMRLMGRVMPAAPLADLE